MKLARIALLCAVVGALIFAHPAYALQTDTHGMVAVPAPGPVAIDGNLSDWDLSGQTLMCYDVTTLRDTNSAQVAMMYDAGNFYVSFHFKSPGLRNHHDPRYSASGGWAADAIQLRIQTDTIAHITAWDYVDKNEPAIQITYGTPATPLGGPSIQLFQTSGWKLEKGAEMAFKLDTDGKGYVQEMKIPWALITKTKQYQPGDKFKCGVELFWGSAGWPDMRYADNLAPGATQREFFFRALTNWGFVTLSPTGHIKLPPPSWQVALDEAAKAAHPPIPVSYNLPRDGVVTLAINDSTGRRVRNLLPPTPRAKGMDTEYWDGKDDSGLVVGPGEYQVTGIVHDPIHLTYALSFANPGNPSWGTPDGRGAFYADHTPPSCVASGNSLVALACTIGEAGSPLIVVDANGQRQWGQGNRIFGSDGITSLATDGKTLYATSDGRKAVIYRDELATGLFSPWDQDATDDQGHTFKVLDLEISPTPAGKDPVTGAVVHNLTAIAVHGGVLAASLALDNQVVLLDADTGAVKQKISAPNVQSVAFDNSGALLVLSNGRVLKLALDGTTTPFTAGSYPDGHSLAVDPNGNVYLSVRGADQNVKVFSPAGDLVREIGVRGGRPYDGAYNENGMLNPAQIAVDATGRLWVTEESFNPKRTSVWDAKTGALLKDLAGSTTYCGAGALNPDDPTMGFNDDTVYKIDWRTGQYKPTYSLGRRPLPNDLFPPKVLDITAKSANIGNYTYVYARDGQTTLFDGKDWRSASIVGQVKIDPKARPMADHNPRLTNTVFNDPMFAGHDGQIFSWSDKNGDGLVQPDELTFASPKADGKPMILHRFYWGTMADRAGDYAFTADGTTDLVRFRVTGHTDCGAPIYDIANPDIVPVGDPLGKGNGEGMIAWGDSGKVYINQNPILSLDPSGKILGSYPSPFTSVHGSHEAGAAHPGYVIGPSSVLGTADFGGKTGEVFDLNGNLGENYLFTSDALLIQTLFKDVRAGFDVPSAAVRGQSMDNITANGESFGGNFIKANDGHVYLTIGSTDARVLQVTGLDTISRFNGTLDVTQAEADAAEKLAEANAPVAAQPKVYQISRAATPPAIDAKLASWPELNAVLPDNPSADISDAGGMVYATVAARYDDNALYLAYRVRSAHKTVRNAGQDEHLLFKSGDAVDVMIGPDPQNGLVGDRRLLMTVKQGSPIAVLNVKSDPSAPKSAHYIFAAPWHQIAFDRVETVTGVTMASAPTADGYLLTAAVPWSVLGITPSPGLKLRGDFGILFADNGGTVTVSRQYWSNKETGLVNDVPGEGDLTPNRWGQFVLK